MHVTLLKRWEMLQSCHTTGGADARCKQRFQPADGRVQGPLGLVLSHIQTDHGPGCNKGQHISVNTTENNPVRCCPQDLPLSTDRALPHMQ